MSPRCPRPSWRSPHLSPAYGFGRLANGSRDRRNRYVERFGEEFRVKDMLVVEDLWSHDRLDRCVDTHNSTLRYTTMIVLVTSRQRPVGVPVASAGERCREHPAYRTKGCGHFTMPISAFWTSL